MASIRVSVVIRKNPTSRKYGMLNMETFCANTNSNLLSLYYMDISSSPLILAMSYLPLNKQFHWSMLMFLIYMLFIKHLQLSRAFPRTLVHF